ncbi:MAG: thiol reductase thioredoxin [Erysipelotrichaceae bacterium]|nr:thiol reductase thioredoxin [Erysipelotrichaceae bacterium]
MIIEIKTPEEYEKYYQTGDVLVDFNAVWCGPCRMLAPNLEDLDRLQYFPNLKILSVDVDKVPTISGRYGIESIPTLLLFKNGKLYKSTVGYQTLEDLKRFIEK